MHKILLVIAAIYFLSHLFAGIFARTRVPDVLLLTFLGLILGPFTGAADVAAFGMTGEVLSAIALVVILFEGGVSVNLRRVARILPYAVGLTLLTFLGTVILTAHVMVQFFNLPLLPSVLTGIILGGVSPAVVIPLAKGLKLGEESFALVSVECALSDVLAVVIAFGFFAAHQSGHLDPGHIALDVGVSLLAGGAIGIVGGILWMAVLSAVRSFPNSTLTTIGFLLLLYSLTDLLHFSGAISAFFFGLTIANYHDLTAGRRTWLGSLSLAELSGAEHSVFQELIFILKTFFFVYVGLSFTTSHPSLELGGITSSMILGAAALAMLLTYGLRLFISRAAVPRRIDWREASLVTLMIPKGLAAAVLAGIPAELGMEGGQLILAVVSSALILSIVLTAVLVPVVERSYMQIGYRRFFRRHPDPAEAG